MKGKVTDRLLSAVRELARLCVWAFRDEVREQARQELRASASSVRETGVLIAPCRGGYMQNNWSASLLGVTATGRCPEEALYKLDEMLSVESGWGSSARHRPWREWWDERNALERAREAA